MIKGDFVKKIETAREAYKWAQLLEESLFNELEMSFENVDLEDVKSNAENAENIKDAICCYLSYGEYSPDEIWNDIIEAAR